MEAEVRKSIKPHLAHSYYAVLVVYLTNLRVAGKLARAPAGWKAPSGWLETHHAGAKLVSHLRDCPTYFQGRNLQRSWSSSDRR